MRLRLAQRADYDICFGSAVLSEMATSRTVQPTGEPPLRAALQDGCQFQHSRFLVVEIALQRQ